MNDRISSDGHDAMMAGVTRTGLVALASLVAFVACSKEVTPQETIRAPAAVASQSPQGAAQRERVGSSRPNVADLDLGAAEKALADASKELGNALALATPDCSVLRPLRDRICELSEHICRLGGADPEINVRCEDGKRRCSDAKDRVGSQCP
jgi:hypothetical protein